MDFDKTRMYVIDEAFSFNIKCIRNSNHSGDMICMDKNMAIIGKFMLGQDLMRAYCYKISTR